MALRERMRVSIRRIVGGPFGPLVALSLIVEDVYV